MKRSCFTMLDQREFNLLCDYMNGSIVDFKDTFWRANFMSRLRDYSNEEFNHFEKWKVDKDELFEKLEFHTNLDFISLIMSIDEFWGEDEKKYHDLDLQCPSSKIDDFFDNSEIQEPICWNPKEQSLEEFIGESMQLGYDFFVNLKDINGKSKCIWVVKEEDLIGFMLSISNQNLFARIQRNDGFVNFDFISFLD